MLCNCTWTKRMLCNCAFCTFRLVQVDKADVLQLHVQLARSSCIEAPKRSEEESRGVKRSEEECRGEKRRGEERSEEE